jgi:hypothetical protein
MQKRGQVTIFLIIAVLVIALIAVFFIFREKLGVQSNSLEISPIQTKIVSCLESTTEEGIIYIGLQGGYYEVPKNVSKSLFGGEIAYYYINSLKSLPSIEKIESELEEYIEINLENCIDFESIEEQGFNVTQGNVSASVNINEDEIKSDIIYPLLISKGEDKYRLTKFESSLNSNIEKVYSASEEVVDSYKANPGFVCMACLEEISKRYEFEIKETIIDEEIIWFSVFDSESELKWSFIVENE